MRILYRFEKGENKMLHAAVLDLEIEVWRVETYARGAICKYPIALTLLSLFFNAANAAD